MNRKTIPCLCVSLIALQVGSVVYGRSLFERRSGKKPDEQVKITGFLSEPYTDEPGRVTPRVSPMERPRSVILGTVNRSDQIMILPPLELDRPLPPPSPEPAEPKGAPVPDKVEVKPEKVSKPPKPVEQPVPVEPEVVEREPVAEPLPPAVEPLTEPEPPAPEPVAEPLPPAVEPLTEPEPPAPEPVAEPLPPAVEPLAAPGSESVAPPESSALVEERLAPVVDAPDPVVPPVREDPAPHLVVQEVVDTGSVAGDELKAMAQTMLIPFKKKARGGGTSGDLVGSPDQQEIYEAMELLLDEEYDEAIPILEKYFRKNPAYQGIWASLGWAYWVLDRQDDALKLWKTVRDLDPNSYLPYNLIGTAYYSLKEIEKAETNFLRSLELKPDQFNVRLRLGVMYRWFDRHTESVDMLEKLYAEDTDRLDVANELALSYYFNEQYEKALPFMPMARKANPTREDYGLAHAKCLLSTGQDKEAVALMDELLEENPKNLSLLILRTEAPSTPENRPILIEYLNRAKQLSENPDQKRMLANRLFDIYKKMYEEDDDPSRLDEPVRVLEELVENEPENVEANLLLAEMSLMRQELDRASELFERVLNEFNANNVRALIGLAEIFQIAANGPKAEQKMEQIRAINPEDPYFNDRFARYSLARYNVPEAYKRIDELERAGFSGAIPILMYGELSRSEWSDKMALVRFTEHMTALKKAGYRFISLDELPDYLSLRHASVSPSLMRDSARVNDKIVAVCFSLPFKNTLEMAHEVARERDLVFSSFIPVEQVENDSSAYVDWETAKRLSDSGIWKFGSFLLEATKNIVVNEDGELGGPLANRAWDETHEALEPVEEFRERVREQYYGSKVKLVDKLGAGNRASFVLYPMGDLGQAGRSNYGQAIADNVEQAREFYEVGLVGTEYGYAVQGDESMLYQYYSPSKDATAEELLNRLQRYHPVFLAWTLRAQVAALDGRRDRAYEMLDLLKNHRYPQAYIDELSLFIKDHLSPAYSQQAVNEGNENPWELVLRDPAIEADARYYEDKINREHFQLMLAAGITPIPQVRLKAFAGYGKLQQRRVPRLDDTPLNDAFLQPADIEIEEELVGVEGRIALNPFEFRPMELSGRVGIRKFSGDASHDQEFYTLGFSSRPMASLSLGLSLEHDAIPSAEAIVDQTSYDLVNVQGIYDIRDWWKLGGTAQRYDISDGNQRDHFGLNTSFEVSEEQGVWLGARYDYVSAEEDREGYWTPYKMNQIGLTGEITKRFGGLLVGLNGFVGAGKEKVPPGSLEAYARLRLQAIEQGWIDELDGPPDTDWSEVFIISGSLQYDLDKDVRLFLRSSYIRQPNHYEFHLSGGARYAF